MENLGESFFQGLVYTNGYFRTSQQVKVIGAVIVHKGGPPITGPYQPGDLILEDGSHIVFNKNLSQASSSAAGSLGVLTWMER